LQAHLIEKAHAAPVPVAPGHGVEFLWRAADDVHGVNAGKVFLVGVTCAGK